MNTKQLENAGLYLHTDSKYYYLNARKLYEPVTRGSGMSVLSTVRLPLEYANSDVTIPAQSKDK